MQDAERWVAQRVGQRQTHVSGGRAGPEVAGHPIEHGGGVDPAVQPAGAAGHGGRRQGEDEEPADRGQQA